MAIIKSNSALISFDDSAYLQENNFTFLTYIQSFDLSIESKRLNHKSLGKDSLIRKQFVKPQINLNINYLQSNNFNNELLFGFTKILSASTKESFAKKLINNSFFNKSANIIFSDLGGDLIEDFKTISFGSGSSYSQAIIDKYVTIAFNKLFLNSYSFSYKINQIPIVSTSFLCSDFIISKLKFIQNLGYYVEPPSEEMPKNFLTQTNLDNLILSSEWPKETLVILMQNFVFENNFSSTSTPGPKIDSFLEGLIQSMDISIDFNRSEFYFLSKNIDEIFDRKITMPSKLNLRISGISYKFETGSIKNFFKEDQKFSCSILVGDPNNLDSNVNKLLFNNMCIESFSYSIDLNGMLNYSIECYVEITDKDGFRILEINKFDGSLLNFLSSDGYTLKASDGAFFKFK